MRTPALLTTTSTEHVFLPSGHEEILPKVSPRFPKWTSQFSWSTYGGFVPPTIFTGSEIPLVHNAGCPFRPYKAPCSSSSSTPRG